VLIWGGFYCFCRAGDGVRGCAMQGQLSVTELGPSPGGEVRQLYLPALSRLVRLLAARVWFTFFIH
jgi:hypothetical protein